MPLTDLGFWLCFIGYLVAHRLLANHVWARNLTLLAASYLFYAWLSPEYLPLLIAMTAATYAFGWWVAHSSHRTLVLSGGLALNAGLLLWFKAWQTYAPMIDLIESGTATIDSARHLLVPVGISYYTFQVISYLVDVYRGAVSWVANPIHIGLYLGYFPKLIAGPIARADAFLSQLTKPLPPWHAGIADGSLLILGGLLKKRVLADNITATVASAFHTPSGLSLYLVLMTFAFYLQLYADFSGYSDIARGMSLMLGINLPANFNRPYLARSPSDFWRRWHISLSNWFRDYVYIPLGGSRVPLFRTMLNLVATMALVGLWHGVKSTYLLWGLFWGLLLAGDHGLRFLRGRSQTLARIRLPRSLAILGMFLTASFGWVLFNSESWDGLLNYLANMGVHATDRSTILWIVGMWAVIVVLDYLPDIYRRAGGGRRPGLVLTGALWIIGLYVLLLCSPAEFHEFLYGGF